MKSFLRYNILLALIFLLSGSWQIANSDVTKGLVSAWKFDGNLRDSAGNNHGEFIGRAALPPANNKPTGKSGPVNLADGIVSGWGFDGNTNDDIRNNDGEFISGEARPPANNQVNNNDKPAGNTGPTNPANGIVSGWSFDGDTDDDIEDNDGEFKGAPAIIAKDGPVYVDGRFGKAIEFDGIDDYIEIPDDESLHLPEGLTVTAWINVRVSVDHGAVCWKGNMIGWGANFSWRVATAGGNTLTWGRCVTGSEKYFATDGVLPGTNQWVHVALTCMSPDAPTNQRAYVNGKDVTAVTGQAGNLTAQPPFLVFEGKPVEIGVGRGYGGVAGADRYFNGLIDEVGIWDRGLTVDEIQEVMNKGLPSRYSVDARGKMPITWGRIKE